MRHGGPLVIVGASYAGLQVAASAREAGYEGRIVLVGAEDSLPYQRPPLSKGFLSGKVGETDLALRPASFFDAVRIELELGTKATALEPASRSVSLSNGRRLAFGSLVVATGSRARRHPALDGRAGNIRYLRSLDDARVLRERLSAAREVVVVGGGFIGLEVASAIRGLGKEVTLLAAGSRLLPRAIDGEIAGFLLRLHRAHGVKVELDAAVVGVEVKGEHARQVHVSNGRSFPCDLVLVGVGADPDVALLASAGICSPDGVPVDQYGRTDHPDIFAAGDCTLHFNRYAGTILRLESVQHAIDQAKVVADALVGRDRSYDAVPRFWSDQYDAKLQMVGLPRGADRRVLRGAPEEGRFSVLHFSKGRLICVQGIGRPADVAAGRRLLAAGRSPPPALAGDRSRDLADFLADEAPRASA
ncbi:NAD(P)/FAD-dependent oxidoreductase [Methylobacterium nodulans]|uniref:FAD-dependent pyridine nucleotide-disulphide oxidoreductase n=1 Tax=Methylobacterium nodulans (strain LMG 21967 / CNCM I-2342 / ORS 2060) TaxID=460265 RepID=B8IVY1_METNO|nr:FAD-dependent oxidoreductase [Methylobacterium nodulans]ACL62571.1 FAD-dependent pyridine nucleotide-disulphide oxidoreductase [Methylobacterium nodulans ORS 2060]